jgi:hypothetical protein
MVFTKVDLILWRASLVGMLSGTQLLNYSCLIKDYACLFSKVFLSVEKPLFKLYGSNVTTELLLWARLAFYPAVIFSLI